MAMPMTWIMVRVTRLDRRRRACLPVCTLEEGWHAEQEAERRCRSGKSVPPMHLTIIQSQDTQPELATFQNRGTHRAPANTQPEQRVTPRTSHHDLIVELYKLITNPHTINQNNKTTGWFGLLFF